MLVLVEPIDALYQICSSMAIDHHTSIVSHILVDRADIERHDWEPKTK